MVLVLALAFSDIVPLWADVPNPPLSLRTLLI